MLKLKNAAGEEIMRIDDAGKEEFKDAKVEEQFKEAGQKLKENEGK